MHIAFLTPEYPHATTSASGGLGTSIQNLVQALIQKGEQVTVFIYGQKTSQIINLDGLVLHLIAQKKYSFGGWWYYRKFLQKYIQKTIDAEKIQLLEVPDWTGISAFMKFSIPVVMRFHGSDSYFCHLEKRKQKFKNYAFEYLAVRKANAYIAPTTFAGTLSKKIFRIENRNVVTIPYGLALESFHNPSPLHFQDGVILYLGTVIRKKGVLELPKILRKVREKLPNSQLLLIGNDVQDIQTGSASTWQLLQQSFSKEDSNAVKYLGKIPYSEVQTHIKNAHVCVFPTYAETLGMVTIESMALHKPVVNSNIGWANELIDHGVNGFLIHPSESQQFADAIVSLMTDATLRTTIATSARAKVEIVFDIAVLVEKNCTFYNQIIQS